MEYGRRCPELRRSTEGGGTTTFYGVGTASVMDVDAIEGVGSTQALDLDDDNSLSSQHGAEDQRHDGSKETPVSTVLAIGRRRNSLGRKKKRSYSETKEESEEYVLPSFVYGDDRTSYLQSCYAKAFVC